MKRRKFSDREILETLAWQNIHSFCFRCNQPFFRILLGSTSVIGVEKLLLPEKEHLHELAIGGSDMPYNCRFSCKECHKRVTNGSKATTLGSSKHIIAKTKRIKAGGKKRRGPPIKSRGFSKTARPFPKRKA